MNWETLNPRIHSLHSNFFDTYNIKLDVLRLDEIHPVISGNKWFKLKHNVTNYYKNSYKGMLTFGGAYSNHLAAFSYLTPAFNIPTIAVIRGEDGIFNSTPTLDFIKKNGTHLEFISRGEYKLRNENSYLDKIQDKFPGFYIIPEGGSNDLGLKGCLDIAKFIKNSYDMICISVGTSTTLKGLLLAELKVNSFLGFSSLKGENLISKDISDFLAEHHIERNVQIINRYQFGGFGKYTPELIAFMRGFKKDHEIETDIVYTSKMFFGINDLILKGEIQSGSRILAIHTGGLQGNLSVNGLF
jgi:1-aminocyclopropane-1-carboxylate deaminase